MGSQLSGSLSKNFSEVVRHFLFVCFTARTPIFDSAHSLILPLMSSYWLLADYVFTKVIKRPQLLPVEINTAAPQLQTVLLLSCHSSPVLWGTFAEKCTLNARALSFLLTLCSLPQYLEFKCFNQWPGSSLFCPEKVVSLPEVYITYKTTIGFFIKDWGQSYSVWCLGKREHKQMLLSYTKWIECESRTHLSKVQTTQDRDRTLFTTVTRCSLFTAVGRDRDAASDMLSFILTAFSSSTRKLTIKIYTYTSPSAKEVYVQLGSFKTSFK